MSRFGRRPIYEKTFGGMFTLMVCWAWGAAWYLSLPAWLASMTQLPGWPKVTRDPEIEQAELVEDGSMLKVTGFPEPPPVAVTLYSTSLRGTEVKVIDWAIFVPFTLMVCWARGAAWYFAAAGLVGVDDAAARVVEGHAGTGDRAHRGAAGVDAEDYRVA